MSAELEMVRQLLEAVPLFGHPDEPLDALTLRANLDAVSGSLALPDGVQRAEENLGGRPADLFTPTDARPGTVLYLHGGGYVIGSRKSHGGIAAALAIALGRSVALLDYRLGPEDPFPAALDDVMAAYTALLAGHEPASIAIAGDSAGGGLALASLVALRDRGGPLPACGVALSPWTDLRCESETMHTRAEADPICGPKRLRTMADAYLGGADPTDPLASPLLADLEGLPPLLLQVGDAEVLLDDSVAFEDRARKAGVDVELEIWDDMIHVFQVFVDLLPEAQQAIERVASYLDERMA